MVEKQKLRQAGPRLREDTARYLAVADDLSRRIAANKLKPRARLPGEHELARTYAVSRVTVRAALSVLERKGLIARQAGIGTFVAAPRFQHDLGKMESLFSQFVSQDAATRTELLEYRPVPVEGGLRLLLRQEKAMLLRRLWYVDNTPFALTRMYLHPSARNTSFADAERYPGYLILEDVLGYRIARAEIKLRAERAGKEISKLLNIRPADPVLVLDRTSYSSKDEPLEHTECFIRSEAIEFRLLVSGSVSLGAGFHRPSRSDQLAARCAAL